MRSILALDVAKKTGWAFGPTNDSAPVSGVQTFGDDGASNDRIWFKALVWLTEQLTVMQPDIVAIEAPIPSSHMAGHTSPQAMERLMGLQAIMRCVVTAKRPNNAKLLRVQTVRKFFIGHGNLPGDEAKRAVRQRCLDLGWIDEERASFDRCDALAVWAMAAADADRNFAANFIPLMQKARGRKAA